MPLYMGKGSGKGADMKRSWDNGGHPPWQAKTPHAECRAALAMADDSPAWLTEPVQIGTPRHPLTLWRPVERGSRAIGRRHIKARREQEGVPLVKVGIATACHLRPAPP